MTPDHPDHLPAGSAGPARHRPAAGLAEQVGSLGERLASLAADAAERAAFSAGDDAGDSGPLLRVLADMLESVSSSICAFAAGLARSADGDA